MQFSKEAGTAMAKKKNVGAKTFGNALTADPDDAPELLNDFFRHGELRHGDRLIRRGRPLRVVGINQQGGAK